MSTALAIAAVSQTLLKVLQRDVPGLGKLSALPPDRARDDGDRGAQLNLFLYQTALNPAWRNMDVPRQVRPGEVGHPPLALNLYYLLTAYGRKEAENGGDHRDDVDAHRVLGQAMRALHDHPVLGRDEIAQVAPADGGPVDSELGRQFERIRVVPHPLSLEDVSKLWSAFQTQYRLSVAYEASVVLIDSDRTARPAPPVLRRGADDRGAIVRAARDPLLGEVTFASGLTVARVFAPNDAGVEPLTIAGENLDAARTLTELVLTGPGAGPGEETTFTVAPDPPPPAGAPDGRPSVGLRLTPSTADQWRAGHYTVTFHVRAKPDPLNPDAPRDERWSNSVTFPVAPRLVRPLGRDLLTQVDVDADGRWDVLRLDARFCVPRVAPGQRASLILTLNPDPPTPASEALTPRYFAVPAGPRLAEADPLDFKVVGLPAGRHRYLVRLRVDGVDSVPVRRPRDAQGNPLAAGWEFDPAQMAVLGVP